MPKPFPEPHGHQPTPGPDDNLAMNQLMVAAVMIVPYNYSPSNSSEEDLESDDESCNTHEERNDSLFLKASFLVLSDSIQCGKIITKRKNTQGSMLIVKSTCLNAVNGHSNVWQSQPKINEAAIGNLLIPAAIFLAATPKLVG